MVHKQSVATTLFEPAKKLSLNAVSCAEEEAHIHIAQRFSSKCQEKINEGECERKLKVTVTLPYVRGVSEKIRKMLEKANVRVKMKPHRTLR